MAWFKTRAAAASTDQQQPPQDATSNNDTTNSSPPPPSHNDDAKTTTPAPKTPISPTKNADHDGISSTPSEDASDEEKKIESSTNNNGPPQHGTDESTATTNLANDDLKKTASNATDSSTPPRTRLQTFLVVFALCLALFLAALDVTIIATAIPTISDHFHSSAGYVWIGSAYLLGNAAFVSMWGKVSDIFGRKPVLLAAVVVFWIGSLLCALSNSMGMLIAARAIQGVGGGGAIALPNICVSDLFSMRERGVYFSLFGGVWAIASAIGPILGGVFTSEVNWRWCFWINLPISGVGFIILVFVLKLHNPRTPMVAGIKAIDWVGSLLCVGGVLMFLMGLEFGGSTFPWTSATVICLIVFGLVTIGLFVLNEWKLAKYPLIPIHLFRHRTSVAAYLIAFFHAFTFISASYFLPLYFQAVLGASSLLSGVYILPYVLALSLVSMVVGFSIKKTGNYKIPICAGLFVAVIGFGLFVDLGAKEDWAKIIIFQIIAGIGIGPNFQSPLIALQTNVEPRDIGSATASFQFLRQLGSSVSVVIGGVIFNNEMQKQFPTLQRELGDKLAHELSGANAAASVQLVGRLPGKQGEIAKSAYWRSMRTMFIVYVSFAALDFAISLFVQQKRLSKDHKEHKTGLTSLKKRQSKAGEEHDDQEQKLESTEKH